MGARSLGEEVERFSRTIQLHSEKGLHCFGSSTSESQKSASLTPPTHQESNMLFANAFRGLRGTATRKLSTTVAPPTEVVAAASGTSLAVAVATTFGTYMLADTLSNFLQHPTQKVRKATVTCVPFDLPGGFS